MLLMTEALVLIVAMTILAMPYWLPVLLVAKHIFQNEKFFFQRNFRILNELQGHLNRAEEWADPIDLGSWDYTGWCCIQSVRDAIDEGRVGLALDRWDSLLPGNRPELSHEAETWGIANG